MKLNILVAKGVGFKHTPLWIAKNVKNIVGVQNWLRGLTFKGQFSMWLVNLWFSVDMHEDNPLIR